MLKQGHVVTEHTFLEALHIPSQPCSDPFDKACKLRKDNTNCFCGLVPALDSYRKKGLWQKDPDGLSKLGADPTSNKREVKPCIICTKFKQRSFVKGDPKVEIGFC